MSNKMLIVPYNMGFDDTFLLCLFSSVNMYVVVPKNLPHYDPHYVVIQIGILLEITLQLSSKPTIMWTSSATVELELVIRAPDKRGYRG